MIIRPIYIEEKVIHGLKIRTKNENEMDSASAKIVPLWQKFDEDIFVDYQNNQRVYGVYHDYESDVNGEFDVLVGYDNFDEKKDENKNLESIKIQKGNYLIFEGTGDMSVAVLNTWGKIWKYFSKENCEFSRLYGTDFEYYQDEQTVKNHIGVERIKTKK